MSLINFESARVKEELRNEKRKAREAVLEKAEADYKRRKEREQRAAERGEDKWMLPSLDAQLQPESHKKKKQKKEKKKKEKKRKKKKKHDSSDNSDSTDKEEWIEKGGQPESAIGSEPTQRDEWMTLPALFPCISRDQMRAKKRLDLPVDEETLKKKFILDNPGQSERELNPYWKDGGKGLPQVEDPLPESLSLAASTAGDHGALWLRRAMLRVEQQAREQDKTYDEVAAERWGSYEKLRNMVKEAESRCRSRPMEKKGGRRQRETTSTRTMKDSWDEDWREDIAAAAQPWTGQSEEVGDKSRYRSWLGLKDPSPPREPSSDEDGVDYEQLDDPPVIEGVEIDETADNKQRNSGIEKDVSNGSGYEDIENDGKILFRSSKVRKQKGALSCTLGKTKVQLKESLTAFGGLQRNSKGKDEDEVSEGDDEKLFEEWRNERSKKGGDDSDDETEDKQESAKGTDKNHADNKFAKIPEKISERQFGEPKKVYTATNSNVQERFSHVQSKEKLLDDVKECGEKKEEDISSERKESEDKAVRLYSKSRGSPSNLEGRNRMDSSNKDKGRFQQEDRKERKERKDDKDDDDYRRKGESDYDRRKENTWERLGSSTRNRRDYENDKYGQEERSRWRVGDVNDRYDKSSRRINDDRHQEREDSRESRSNFKRDNHGDKLNYDSLERRSDRYTGSRRTEIPDYLRKYDKSPKHHEKDPRRRLEGFQKPDEETDMSKCVRPDVLGDVRTMRGSSGVKNWRKKEFCKLEEKTLQIEQHSPSKLASKPLPSIQPAQPKEEEKQPEVQMTDAEMNALGAKVLKAEILGNHALAAKLKAQLEKAQVTRKQQGRAPASASATSSKTQLEETVLLTQRDSKGFVRPVGAPSHPEPSGGRRKPQRVATHGSDGLRERFFPDDDKYTLENMFQKEKMTTMEESNEEFCRLASKGAGRPDSEYDLDDIFAEKISREKAPGKLQALERNRAIQQHKRVEKSLDSCTRCFDSPRMLKHLMVALGSKVYLSLPAHQSLTEGHCFVVPIHHVPCTTLLDEDVWEEMNSFRKALVAMFLQEDEDCVFFESAMHLRRFPHMVLECVPMPKEIGDSAPIYFKKAIMESEMEWSMNKKLVDLKGKGVRRAVPKGLPYFAIDFGNDDGFAHVIEDEKLFPENFAQEIIGGMLDLDHSLWRKQRRENFDTQRQKILKFAERWKKFDVTKQSREDSSSSSSDSEKD